VRVPTRPGYATHAGRRARTGARSSRRAEPDARGALPKRLHAVRPLDRHITRSLTPGSGGGGGEAGAVVVPAGCGLVAAPPGGPAQREGEPGAGDQPGERLACQAGQPGGLGDGQPDRCDPGRARLAAAGGDGTSPRGISRSASSTSSSWPFAGDAWAVSWGGQGDVAAQGVADGRVAELGEGGQRGVPAAASQVRAWDWPSPACPFQSRTFPRPPAAPGDGDETGHGRGAVFAGAQHR
jgi:hypothetical protein